tara:strand:+ start:10987 stop:11091 length:105 start_codon:yes stop_codon:yes gene_type:complete
MQRINENNFMAVVGFGNSKLQKTLLNRRVDDFRF